MTNTLHRRGTQENLTDDFVVFCLPARGHNAKGSAPKVQQFMRICLKHGPANLGDGRNWNIQKKGAAEMEKCIARKKDGEMAAAVFTDLTALQGVLDELIEADLGISINVSGLFEEVRSCCKNAGIERHSVEHSLGVWGAKDRLPEREILEVNTLCGHGMVSFNLIRKMAEQVRLRKMTPGKGAEVMARCCVCGAFNPQRAALLLDRMVRKPAT